MQKAKNLEKVVEEEVEDFGDGYFAGAQQTLWDLFEKPQTSFLAKLLSLWSIGWVDVWDVWRIFDYPLFIWLDN